VNGKRESSIQTFESKIGQDAELEKKPTILQSYKAAISASSPKDQPFMPKDGLEYPQAVRFETRPKPNMYIIPIRRQKQQTL
jgi:hypothetical protein